MADTGPSTPSQGWRVVSQQETLAPAASGTFTRGIQVFFVTARGNTASVFLPESQYSADNVRAAIAAKVANLDGVSDLTG